METLKMSSKGQVVIPKSIRQIVHAGEGTLFCAIAKGNAIVLKKLHHPSEDELLQELDSLAKEGRKRMKSMGITSEKDLIHRSS